MTHSCLSHTESFCSLTWSLTLDKATFQEFLIKEIGQFQGSPGLSMKYYLLSTSHWFGCEF